VDATVQLLHETDGALARLELSQWASRPSPQQPHPLWTLELPVTRDQRTDLFQLRIEEDAEASRDIPPPRPWSVMLAFDLPSLGPVHARLTIHGQQVSTTLWAERAGTAALFDQHLADLRAGLQRAGVMVGRLSCTVGAPLAPPPPAAGPGLVDERA
jgi:hypothetical protein